MKIYLTCPPTDTLAAYAFERFPDARLLHIVFPTGDYRDYAGPIDRQGTGVPYTFSPDYLWTLMKSDQALYEQTHPHALDAQQQEELARG